MYTSIRIEFNIILFWSYFDFQHRKHLYKSKEINYLDDNDFQNTCLSSSYLVRSSIKWRQMANDFTKYICFYSLRDMQLE